MDRAVCECSGLGLRVTDRYDGHDGMLEVRALGIPLQRRHGPNLAQGEICRYLAEIRVGAARDPYEPTA